VAGGGTQAPLAEAAIEAGEEAGEVAADIGGVAIAVDLAPGADALRPEREVGGLHRSSERRRLDREGRLLRIRVAQAGIRQGGGSGVGEDGSAGAKRGERPWAACIGCLP